MRSCIIYCWGRRTPCSIVKWVEVFGELIALGTTTHFWVIRWSLHMWRGLWDQRLLDKLVVIVIIIV